VLAAGARAVTSLEETIRAGLCADEQVQGGIPPHAEHGAAPVADLERRITESFAKAVEQLGSDKLETRLGSIYTLERISQESEREHWPIMEVLTAYVREHARWSQRKEQDQDQAIELDLWDHLIELRPAMDVQAILTVLGRRNERVRKQDEAEKRHLDLSRTDLRGAHLGEAHLERANLIDAHLEGAWLTGAHLEGALLMRADFSRARLIFTQFKGAALSGTQFHGANLMGAHFEGTNLKEVKGLIQKQINEAFGNAYTILQLPEGLEPPAHWTKR
jgi:hypothetical protein